MTNPLKQNIRYQKADTSWRKTRYTGLNNDQKKLVKLVERSNVLNKDLNNFWATAPRLGNGSVDWNKLPEKELDYFESLNHEIESIEDKIETLEIKGISQTETMDLFYQLNIKSVCFGY